MEEQQRIHQLVAEKNGKHPHPLLPVYTAPFQENKTDELDFRHILAVARRRAILIGSVAFAISATFWFSTLSRQARYQGKFQLLVEPETVEKKLTDLTQSPGTYFNQEEGLDYETQIQVLQSPKLMAPIIKQISTRYPNISYGSVLRNLKITRLQKTKILEISYQDSEPQKIQFILQQLAKAYLKYSLEERQSSLSQGIGFVDSQLPQIQSEVNNLQKELQQFRQRHNFIDSDSRAQQITDQASTIELQRVQAQDQLDQMLALYKSLQGRSGIQLAQTPALFANLQDRSGATELLNEAPIYQSLVSQLRNVENEIATMTAVYREDSPMVQTLQQKRKNLLSVLRHEAGRALGNKLVEVENQISLLKIREANLTQTSKILNQQVQQMPVLARQYTDLLRELKLASDSLNRFLGKRQSLQIEIAQKQIPWQLLAAPETPQVPISPDMMRNLILGVIAGILAGLGAGLLAERLDNVFHSPEDLKEVTKLPLLGVIPFHKNIKQLAPITETSVVMKPDGYSVTPPNINNAASESYFPFLEAFRSLYTNIGFLGSDKPINSLVISSAVHGEGKSTVSLNLAQAAAAMGQRVLLVDADLRLPQIHTLLGLPNHQGLSNVIATNLPVLEVIQRSPFSDNLFVLTSGQIPPDPTKLLSSKKMQNIMELLRQQFDLVIYDTPPFLGLADSSLLASYTSGIVLVARMGKTNRSTLIQSLDQLKISRAAVLGTVCNGVKNYNTTDSGYYYYRPRNHSDQLRNQSVGLK